MNKNFRIIFLSLLILFLSGMSLLEPAMAGDPVPQMNMKIQLIKTKKGITAWLLEDHSLPIISIAGAFKGGSLQDPPTLLGLANMVSVLLNEGAGSLDALQFKEQLQDYAIEMGFGSGGSYLSFSLRTTTEYQHHAFDLLKSVWMTPRFDETEISKAKDRLTTYFANANQDPGYRASRALSHLLFEKQIYGNSVAGTLETTQRIQRADLQSFAKKYFSRDHLFVTIVGDTTPEAAAVFLDTIFGDLPEVGADTNLSPPTISDQGKTEIINLNTPQSVAIFAHRGITYQDPQWPEALILSYVLGGGSSSRLMQEVRHKRGLSYGVSVECIFEKDFGLIMGNVAAENSKMAETLALIKTEWRRLRDHGLTKQELEDAKAYLQGAFVLRFTNTMAIASQLLAYQIRGEDVEFVNMRNKAIDSITLEQVNKFAKKILDPDALMVAIGGNSDTIG